VKKLLLLLPLLLGGCSTIDKVIGISVPSTDVVAAASAFDAAEAVATQYVRYCVTHRTAANCTRTTVHQVQTAVLSGRAARNALEPSISSGTAGPVAAYNALTAAVNTLTQLGTAAGATP
jgi:hypothetical protein